MLHSCNNRGLTQLQCTFLPHAMASATPHPPVAGCQNTLYTTSGLGGHARGFLLLGQRCIRPLRQGVLRRHEAYLPNDHADCQDGDRGPAEVRHVPKPYCRTGPACGTSTLSLFRQMIGTCSHHTQADDRHAPTTTVLDTRSIT